MDLKLLKQQMSSCVAEMDTLEVKIGEAEKANNAADITKYQNEFKAKSLEFDKLNTKVDEAKAHGARKLRIVAIGEMSEIEMEGKTIPVGTVPAVPAVARNEEKEEQELIPHFKTVFFGDGRVSDSARDVLSPKGKSWKEGANGIRLPKPMAKLMMPEAFAMRGKALPTTSTGAAGGGNLFEPDFQQTLLQYLGEPAWLFPRALKIPCRFGTVLWPQLSQAAPGAEGTATEFAEYGYAAVAWTAEGAQAVGTEPKFTQASLATFELAARSELSRQLINRSVVNVEELLTGLFRASIMHKIDLALINGDGVGKPTGILQLAGIGSSNRLVANQVTYDDFVNLETQLAPQLRAGAIFVIADGALQYVKKVKDSQGRPLFLPYIGGAGQFAASQIYGTILGYPVIPTQRTTLGASGDVILANMDNYVCPIEQEIIILRSEHQKIDQGVIVYVVFMQIGGKPVQTRAFAKLNP